jgi:hypothetical protein
VIEAQRRIHELEAQREQEYGDVPRTEDSHAGEPPAFLIKEERPEPREERVEPREPRTEHPEPRTEYREPRTEHHEAVRAEPPAPPAPRIDPKELLDQAGLVMIETDRSKAPVVQPAPQEDPAHLGRPRRERAKPAKTEEELQQVETKR